MKTKKLLSIKNSYSLIFALVLICSILFGSNANAAKRIASEEVIDPVIGKMYVPEFANEPLKLRSLSFSVSNPVSKSSDGSRTSAGAIAGDIVLVLEANVTLAADLALSAATGRPLIEVELVKGTLYGDTRFDDHIIRLEDVIVTQFSYIPPNESEPTLLAHVSLNYGAMGYEAFEVDHTGDQGAPVGRYFDVDNKIFGGPYSPADTIYYGYENGIQTESIYHDSIVLDYNFGVSQSVSNSSTGGRTARGAQFSGLMIEKAITLEGMANDLDLIILAFTGNYLPKIVLQSIKWIADSRHITSTITVEKIKVESIQLTWSSKGVNIVQFLNFGRVTWTHMTVDHTGKTRTESTRGWDVEKNEPY